MFDSRTRSVCGGAPDVGIVDCVAIRTGRGGAIRMAKAPVVQGFEFAPQTVPCMANHFDSTRF